MSGPRASALERAGELLEQLRDRGEVESAELLELARERGISTRTLERARADHGCFAVKRGARWFVRFAPLTVHPIEGGTA